jgi:hypothetical protein
LCDIREVIMTAELGSRGDVARAAELVRRAIQILDGAGAPSDIAAHLDLALVRLETLDEVSPLNGESVSASPGPDAPEAN